MVVEVNGNQQPVQPNSSMELVLERGTHTVQAIVQDARGRAIVTSELVTFFVKQHSANFG